ncbi:MAG: tetratricopeptide repeat protein [Bacteroidota bacterium]
MRLLQENPFLSILEKTRGFYVILVTFRTRQLGPICSTLLMCLLSSCAVYDFFSQRYENTTAYFNTYYNAKRLFDEAEADVEAVRLSKHITDKTESVQLSPQTRQKFNQVIEKCSKLLQFYPTSKWVDDALFVIGASYYYLDDDRKAQRKFAELLSAFPKSGLAFKSRLWLGMSLYRMENYPEATQVLDQLIQVAQEKKKEEFAIEGMFLLGRTFSEQKAYAESIRMYRRIIETSDDDRTRSRAQLLIGQVYAEQDSLDRASEAYAAVLKFDPEENSKFEAGYQHAVILNQIGKHEEALEILKSLRRQVKSSEFYPRIDLQLADTYNAMNLLDEAIDQYVYVDTTYRRTEVSAKAYFALGVVYEKKLLDYHQAMKSYEKARNEFPKADITKIAQSKWQSFQNYFLQHKTIANFDSLLSQLENPSSTKTSVDPIGVGSDSLASDTMLVPAATLDSSVQVQNDSSALILRESYASKLAEAMYGLGNLFFLEINIPDSAEYWYHRVISEHPASNVAARALYSLAEIYRSSEDKNRDAVNLLYRTLIEKYPETQYAEEARRFLGMKVERETDPAAAVYARGETLLLEGKIESALSVFRSVIQDYPESPSVPKSKYALGWIFENVKMNADSAHDYYRQVFEEYPNSAYAEAVKAKLIADETLNKEAESSRAPTDPKPAPDKKVTESEEPIEPEEKMKPPP